MSAFKRLRWKSKYLCCALWYCAHGMFIQSIINIAHPCITCIYCCVQTVEIVMKKYLVCDSSSEEAVSGRIVRIPTAPGLLFPICACSVFMVRLWTLRFWKNLFSWSAAGFSRIINLGQVLGAQGQKYQEWIKRTCPGRPLVKSAFIAAFLNLNFRRRESLLWN